MTLVLFTASITSKKPVDIDYEVVIQPLKRIHGPAEYLKAVQKHEVVDVQPVRDLSLKLDLILAELIGAQTHGLFNAILWGATGIVLILMLGVLNVSPPCIYLVSLTFLVHPLASWVVSWPTARKHLLAMFFIALASYLSVLLKQKRLKFPSLIFLCYLLSVLSQPISLLWILCFFVYFFDEIKRLEVLALFYLLCGVFLIVGLANYVYYGHAYEYVTGVPKLMAQTNVDLATSIAAVSRSVAQIFYPVNFAFDYVKSSVLTLLGLPTCALFFIMLATRLQTRVVFFFALLVFTPLLVVYYRPTNIFVSDTYIIIPLFFTVLGLGLFLSGFRLNRKFTVAWSLLLIVLLGKSLIEQRYASNWYEYYRKSYEREPTCRNALPYAVAELNRGHFKNFRTLTEKAMQANCILLGHTAGVLTTRVYYYRVLLDQNLSLREKFRASKTMNYVTPDLAVIQAILNYLVNGGEFVNVDGRILAHLGPDERKVVMDATKAACEMDRACDQKRLIDFFKY